MWQSYIQEKGILLNPWFKNGPFPLAVLQNSKPKGPFRHEYIFYCFSSKLFLCWCFVMFRKKLCQADLCCCFIFSFLSACKRVTSGSDSLLKSVERTVGPECLREQDHKLCSAVRLEA